MANKEAINFILSKTSEYLKAYQSEDIEAINNINIIVLSFLKKEDKIPKNKADNLEKNILTFAVGNHKIGEDTLCINVSTALNCPMSILGDCNNCNICYAKRHNKQYLKNTVAKNLINQNIFNKVLLGEVTVGEVADNLIEAINKDLTKKQVANLRYLRLNVEGDFLNNDILKVVNDIVFFVVRRYGLISCYTYTHNRRLNFEVAPQIIFNCSDFEVVGQKTCQVCFEVTDNLRQKIINREVILCGGDCSNCSYCKNRLDNRKIYFMAHGGEFEGIEAVDVELRQIIEDYKKEDYKLFLSEFGL